MPFLGMLKLIPSWVYQLIGVLLIAFSLVMYGEHRTQVKWDAERAANKAHAEKVVAVQTVTTAAAEQKQEKTEIQIQTVFKDRIIYKDREVPREVIVKEDSECTIPDRFISMWNSANSGTVPESTGSANAAANGSGKP